LSYDQIVRFLHDLNLGLDIKQVGFFVTFLCHQARPHFHFNLKIKSRLRQFEKSPEMLAEGHVTPELFIIFFEKLSVRQEIVDLIAKFREEGDEVPNSNFPFIL